MSTQKEATIWQQLGDIIRRERVANGLTYASVAKRSGVAVRTLMHFEQGENENGGNAPPFSVQPDTGKRRRGGALAPPLREL